MNSELRSLMLQHLDRQLSIQPNDMQLKFNRACLLAEIGHTTQAIEAYVDILKHDPAHKDALNNVGKLLYETKRRSAARLVFKQAIARHPQDPMGYVNLGELLMEDGEFAAARENYEAALRINPDYSQAHRGLSYVFKELGDERQAVIHRQRGFQNHPVLLYPHRGEHPPISLLLLVSAVGGNVPIMNFLDNGIFQTYLVFVEFCGTDIVLPPHQIVFNAIGDADAAAPALIAAMPILTRTTGPVLNLPSAVLATGRMSNTQRFSGISGVVTPKICTVPRKLLESADAARFLEESGFQFPILLRTPGYHTGQHFYKVEGSDELSSTVEQLPGNDLFVMQFIDTRRADGKFRKYRVMMIQGQLYPLHLAISGDWKVHYFTADMAECPEHRWEEAEFLNHMPDVLGPKTMSLLKQIQDSLALDYAGVDFSLNAAGNLILFEANATMVVNLPEPDECWNYRRHSVDEIYKAVRNMLINKESMPYIGMNDIT